MKNVLCILVAMSLSWAQGQDDSSWDHTLTLYGLGAGLDGTVESGFLLESDVAVDFAKIRETMEMAALVHYEARSDKWYLISDFIFIGLGATAGQGLTTTDVDVDQVLFELAGAYRVSPTFDILFGARYSDIAVKIDPKITAGATELDLDWVDPIIGLRFQDTFGEDEKFGMAFRADFGGLGSSTDTAWNGIVRFDYRPTAKVFVSLGYRYYDVEHEEGKGRDKIVYDMLTDGPLLGVTFRF